MCLKLFITKPTTSQKVKILVKQFYAVYMFLFFQLLYTQKFIKRCSVFGHQAQRLGFEYKDLHSRMQELTQGPQKYTYMHIHTNE